MNATKSKLLSISICLSLVLLAACSELDGLGLDPYIISFSASPSSIEAGESSTLSWSILGGPEDLAVTLTPGNIELDKTGEYQVTPTETTTYTLTAGSEGKTVSKSVVVNVDEDTEEFDLTLTTQKNTPVDFLLAEKEVGDYIDYEATQGSKARLRCTDPGADDCSFDFNVAYIPAQDFTGEEIITITTYLYSASEREVVSVWKIKVTVVEDFDGPSAIEVTSVEDGTAGSLRQALIDAAPGATITFAQDIKGLLPLQASLRVFKDVTIVGDVVIDAGLFVAENVSATFKDLSFTDKVIGNSGNLILDSVRVFDVITTVDRARTTPLGAVNSRGNLTLQGSTEITGSSRGVYVESGVLTLKDEAVIFGNVGNNSSFEVDDGGGVFVAQGGKLVGAIYGAESGNNIFDNVPDDVFFVAGDPSRGECATKVVEFKSDRLEEAIRAELELYNAPVTCERMKALTELDAHGSIDYEPVIKDGVDDLSGLEYAINLTKLDLTGGGYQDLSPLASLSKLEYLQMDFTSFRDISVLLNLPWSGTDDYVSLQYAAVCEPDIEALREKVEEVAYIQAGAPCEAQPGN